MKKITVYILLLLLLSSICSCLDDKNNYDYTPINELKGTISNIEKNYSVGIDEDLVITPTFEFTMETRRRIVECKSTFVYFQFS